MIQMNRLVTESAGLLQRLIGPRIELKTGWHRMLGGFGLTLAKCSKS